MHVLEFARPICEIFNIAIVPNCRSASIAGLYDGAMASHIRFGADLYVRPEPNSQSDTSRSVCASHSLIQPLPHQALREVKYQRVHGLTLANADNLRELIKPDPTLGPLNLSPNVELDAVAALSGSSIIALTTALRRSDQPSILLSIWVRKNWRNHGIGTRIYELLLRVLTDAPCPPQSLELGFSSEDADRHLAD